MYDASELPDFLAAVSAETDPVTALERGLALIATAFDADAVAFVHGKHIVASAGPGADERLFLDGARDRLTVVGFDRSSVSSIDLVESEGVALIVRSGPVLTRVEAAHAETMVRALELTVRLLEKVSQNQRLLDEHRAHRAVLEAILRIQRLISQRQPVDSILEAITSEALSLLGADLGGVSLAASTGPWRHSLVSATEAGRTVADDVAVRSLSEWGLYAAAENPGRPRAATFEGSDGHRHRTEIIGTPVFEDGAPVGALFVVVAQEGGGSTIDSAAMELFASQASIALTDAWTMSELEHAFHDPLTGLPNRALFHDRFGHALDLGVRRGTPTGLLFLDLDRFKRVNDTLGHAAGDELLRSVGTVLSEACRTCDSVARLGGDEFALVLEDTDADAAATVASRLLSSLADVVNPAGEPEGPGVSIGIAYSTADCSSMDELMRRADIAMYAAKANGGRNALLYDSSMGQSRLDHNSVAGALTSALERDEFVVHYQPIVDLRTKQISSVEALVRWEDPARGLVPPGAFIDDAEATGVIVEIGHRVLEVACAQVATWRRDVAEAADLQLSVNVSTRQLWHDDFKADLAAVLQRTELDPGALVLEVTESIFLDDANAAGQRLQGLKDLGVRLAIDDFGTGFSSLSYVHNYPFDILKIDRAFVEGIGTSANGGAIVRTMLALAQQLSMASVAEGIETVGELAQLRALRCSHGQGFLFSKPVPASELEAVLFDAGGVAFPAPMTSA